MIATDHRELAIHHLISDIDWLNARLSESARWPHGRLVDAVSDRIGAAYGLSGEVYRVRLGLAHGRRATLIAKLENAERTRRAVIAHHHLDGRLARRMPAAYASFIDGAGGIVLLEDINPAVQGDDLTGCSTDQVRAIVALIADLHGLALPDVGTDLQPETWTARPAPPDRWAAVVERAQERYPDLQGSIPVDALRTIPQRVAEAVARLSKAGASWIHVDPHLDNILWRPGGAPVLVDWSNARLGPRGVDLASLLVGYAFRTDPPLSPDELLDAYAAHAATEYSAAVEAAGLGVIVMIQGLIGWVGEPSNEGFHPRKAILRDDAAARVIRAMAWSSGV